MRNANSGPCTRLFLAVPLLLLGLAATLSAQFGAVQQRPGSMLAPKVTPTLVHFQAVTVGESSSGQVVTLRNLTTSPISVNAVQLIGPGAAEFQFTLSKPTPFQLAPGAAATAEVFSTPLTKGLHGARLQFVHGGRPAVQTASVGLLGSGIGLPGNEYTVNAGGGAVSGNQEWSADFAFKGGQPISTVAPIAGASDLEVLQTAREGGALTYRLSVPPGQYDLRVSFAEIGGAAPGERVFDVFAESAVIAPSLDLADIAGANTAYTVERRLFVLDGELRVTAQALAGLALISGIEVSQVPLLVPTPGQLEFGALTSGTSTDLLLELSNVSDVAAELTEIAFVNGEVGNSEAFTVDLDGVLYPGGATDVQHAVSRFVLPAETLVLPITFAPTIEQLDGFELVLRGNFDEQTVAVSGLGGHEGHPYLHVVIQANDVTVDYDGNGTEPVTFYGEDSHTHEPGHFLTTHTWSLGGQPAGTGDTQQLVLPLGPSTVDLTIEDDNVPAESWSDHLTVGVYPISQVPGVNAFYHDVTGVDPVTLVDGPLGAPDFAEVLPTFQIVNDGGAGSSGLTAEFLVHVRGLVDLAVQDDYTFTATGGAAARIAINSVFVPGPSTTVNLTPGVHSVQVVYAVQDLSQLPLGLSVDASLAGPIALSNEQLFHDDTGALPVINSLPAAGTSLGGNAIVVEGYGFFPTDQVVVHWGSTDLTGPSFDSITPTEIRFTSPPGSGQIPVTVETPQGISNPRSFLYSADGPVPINFQLASVTSVPDPTSGAFGPDGRFYVGTFSGHLYAVEYDAAYQPVSVQQYLGVSALTNYNILGVTFDPWDAATPVRVYVSHGELFVNGGSSFTGPSPYTGQISVLEGPNFDTPVPVVTQLPSSNHDHGVNGMEFDNNGDLLVSIGSMTNAGVKWPSSGDLPESPLAGAIVKAELSRQDFNGALSYVETLSQLPNNDQVFGELVDLAPGTHVEVHTPGVRNAFDLVLSTRGYLYSTENGPNPEFGPASTGANTEAPGPYYPDEFLLLERGRYYGHPNRNRGRYDERQNVFHGSSAPGIPDVYTPPLDEVVSSTDGITEFRSDVFGGQMRGELIAQKWGGNARRLKLTADGRGLVSHFAMQPKMISLDVAMGPGGSLFGTDYSGGHVRVLEPVDVGALGLQVHDITPWRAPATGGTPFVLGGVGFGTLGNTGVTIGGHPATLTSVGPTRIEGLVPLEASPGTELLDVVVTVNLASDTLTEAFRYLLPKGQEPGRWNSGPNATAVLGEVACGVIDGVLYMVGEGNGKTLGWHDDIGWWNNNLTPRTFKGHHHAAEVLDGKWYLIGGLGAGSEGKVQIYDPQLNSWSLGADMPWPGGSVSTALIDGMLYAAGGIVGTTTVPDCAVYDPLLDTWTSLTPMPLGRNHAAAGTDGERLFVFGGRDQGNWVTNGFAEVQVYDPLTDTWETSSDLGSTLAPLPIGRGGTGKAVYMEGEFYVFGGETGNGPGATPAGTYDRVDVFDPALGTWRLEAPLLTPRHGIFPVLSEGNRIFVAGGGPQAAASASNVFEIFTRQ